MKKKVYKGAPLPFMGQKRNFLKAFKEALKDYPKDAIYVDLFGGSGLLAHTTKNYYQDANVVYNDFDNYRQRIDVIPETNDLLAKIRPLLKDCPKGSRITGKVREDVLNVVKLAQLNNEFVDYITLSSSLLFSMKYVLTYDKLVKETLYNCVRKNDYDATGYLDGISVVNQDYKVLFKKYKDNKRVVFLIDPPYLQTNVSTYNNYWNLGDYLDVLDVLDNQRYFYFTSNKSSILELCEWVENKSFATNPFNGATKQTMTARVTYNSTYTDIMLFKNNV